MNEKKSKSIASKEEQLAILFHSTYERLAPNYDYKTRKASAVPWEDVPENNKKLMIAVCKEILEGDHILY